jgi:hypothetical protein
VRFSVNVLIFRTQQLVPTYIDILCYRVSSPRSSPSVAHYRADTSSLYPPLPGKRISFEQLGTALRFSSGEQRSSVCPPQGSLLTYGRIASRHQLLRPLLAPDTLPTTPRLPRSLGLFSQQPYYGSTT